jgi:hypothetical protein
MSELERALVALGREIEVPEAPDLVPAVLASIERRDAHARPAWRPRWAARWAVAVALAAVAVFGALLAIPDARSAFLRVIGFGGEEIRLVDELPPVSPHPDQLDLDVVLGRPVTLAEARDVAGFPLRELEDAPDRVYLGERGTVWFLYGTPDDVRLLVAQTPRATVDEPYVLQKLVPQGTEVAELEVDGKPALFLGGEPHVVALVDASGELIQESARLAQNVLVWEDGDVAIRLEGAFTGEEAVELAESMELGSG